MACFPIIFLILQRKGVSFLQKEKVEGSTEGRTEGKCLGTEVTSLSYREHRITVM